MNQKKQMDIEVTVHGVMPDPLSESHILMLKPKKEPGDGFLPIWIGAPEANAIRAGLGTGELGPVREGILSILPVTEPGTLRPMTHDLAGTILSYLRLPLKRVLIHSVDQGTFFANMEFSHRGTDMVIDARPSDAVALAVRLNAPLFIREALYQSQAATLTENREIEKNRPS